MEIDPLQSLAQRARKKENRKEEKRKSDDGDKSKSAKKSTTRKSTTKDSGTKKPTATRETSKKTTVKKTTAKKTITKKSNTPSSTSKRTSSSQAKTSRATGLVADLKKNAEESYDRADLLDGIQLAVRLAGIDVIQQTVLALVTDWVPGVGDAAEKKAVDLIVKATKEEYPKCNASEKKGLRAVIHWIRNDFDLRSSLSPAELVSGIFDTTADK